MIFYAAPRAAIATRSSPRVVILGEVPLNVINCDGVGKQVRIGHSSFGRWRGEKSIECKAILRDVSFDISQGECVGLLGNNGAGKTTLMRSICGMIGLTSGQVTVFGWKSAQRKPQMLQKIGFMSAHRPLLWPEYRILDSFHLLKSIYRVSDTSFDNRLEELCSKFQLIDHIEQTQSSLSFGQRIKAELVSSLLHDPDLLILDEPTTGLDMASQKSLRSDIRDLTQGSGKTVLLSSHSIPDVADLCSRFLFLDHGELVLDITLPKLMQVYAELHRLELEIPAKGSSVNDMLKRVGHISTTKLDGKLDNHNASALITIIGKRDDLVSVQQTLQQPYPDLNAKWSHLTVHDAIEVLCTNRGVLH